MSRFRPNPGPMSLLLCIVAVFTLGCPAARAGAHKLHKEKPKQTIVQMEQAWRTATLDGNATELEPLLSDDYVGISWTGQVSTKAMMLDRMRKRLLILNHLELDDMKIKVVNTIAIVTAIAVVDGVNDGVDMHGIFRYTRIYQRQPSGAWKVTNFEATRAPQARIRTASSATPSQ